MDSQDIRVDMLENSLVTLLELSNESDLQSAKSLIDKKFVITDLSFNPEYQACLGRAFSWKVCLLHFNVDNIHFVKYVRLSEVKASGKTYGNDVYSTYGHGGWICNAEATSNHLKCLSRAETLFFQNYNIICEYCEVLQKSKTPIDMLLHPSDFVRKKSVLWLDLTAPVEVIWSAVREKQRKAIISSLKKGVLITADGSTLERVQRFEKEHELFLKAKNSKSFWHFPSGFFEKFYKHLSPKQVFCFDAKWNTEVIGSFYALNIDGCVYYFFSHSNPDFKSMNCNSSLMWFLIMNSKAKGYHSLYLGGGLLDSKNDPLYRFKKSFGGMEKDYYVMRRVVNYALYQRVLNLIDPISLEADVFPPYLTVGKVQ